MSSHGVFHSKRALTILAALSLFLPILSLCPLSLSPAAAVNVDDLPRPLDTDVATLLTVLQRTAVTVQHDHGMQAPPRMAPAESDRLIVTPAHTPADHPQAITLWIMPSHYSAAELPASQNLPQATELDRWNGHRVFAAGDMHSQLGKALSARLAATAGPLTASIIVSQNALQFELKNRSDKPVRIEPLNDVLSINEGWNVYADEFCTMTFDSSTLEQMRAAVVTIAPGQRLAWPMRANELLVPGTDAKVDAEYSPDESEAAQIGAQTMWIVAPSVRVHTDAQHQITVIPWQPTPLTPAEQTRSLRLTTFAEPWLNQLRDKLAFTQAPNTPPQHFVYKDADGNVTAVSYILVNNMGGPDSTNGATEFHIHLTAVRAGPWQGLAQADTMDPIKWDGRQTSRAYRVPGTDWILRAKLDKGASQKAQDAIDESFNAFLHANKPPSP